MFAQSLLVKLRCYNYARHDHTAETKSAKFSNSPMGVGGGII